MDDGHFGAGASDDRFHPKRHDVWWLYDPISEEFRRDPGTSEERWMDDRARGLKPFEPQLPRLGEAAPGRAIIGVAGRRSSFESSYNVVVEQEIHGSMLISVRAAATYELAEESFVLLMVEPAPQAPDHRVKDVKLVTSPAPFSVLGTDHAGNPQRRIVAPAGKFRYEYTATIEAEPNIAVPPDAVEHRPWDLPPETLVYVLPSRYIQSDRFRQMAQGEFGSLPRGGSRVQAICDWVRAHLKYEAGSTDETTTVMDTAVVRLGVCRDFAQMVIALCRGLGIPARYVSGYALGLEPFDFHAFAQVYVGGRWYNVDATHDGIRPALIPIAAGRDAADVDMATFTGPNKLKGQKLEIKKLSD